MKDTTIKLVEHLVSGQNRKVKETHEYIGITSIFPEDYKEFLNLYDGISGSIGENSYIQLWRYGDIEELNEAYATMEFLSGVVLIGSDGGEVAYGINRNKKYIEVPFIGMDDDEVQVIADDFDEFIEYLLNK